MKVDYEKFPQIPPGCSLNENRKANLFQVYRTHTVKDPKSGKSKLVRETMGSIRDGVFRPSETYTLRQKVAELEKKCAEQQALLDKQPRYVEEVSHQAAKVQAHIEKAAEKAKIDSRDQGRIHIPMANIALVALVAALCGTTDAAGISDFIGLHREFFDRYLPDAKIEEISHDTVRRCLMLVDTRKFECFVNEMTSCLVRRTFNRVVAADGQAIRATGRRSRDDGMMHGARMVMNFYDTNSRVCLAQELIDKKTNEITVAPRMIESLSLAGSVVTADAMNCQVGFVNSVLDAQADYMIALKGNQENSWKEAMALFSWTDRSQVLTFDSEYELDHGRVERRRIEVLPGRLMSKDMIMKWRGLACGSLVRVTRESTYKSTGRARAQTYGFYVTSIAPYEDNVDRIYEAIRAHWSIENNLHYVLDVFWNQDAISAKNPCYIANRSALNKMALAYVENYRYWLWNTGRSTGPEPLPLTTMQTRCHKPEVAIECLAVGLGYLR